MKTPSLKHDLLLGRAKSPSLFTLKGFYQKGNHSALARWLPHFQENNDPFVKFLFDSNLLLMGKAVLELKSFTLGADPEFILAKKDKLEKGIVDIVLFSSKLTNDYFGLSEAEIGADYGLLEFRPPPAITADKLVNTLGTLHAAFEQDFGMLKREIGQKNIYLKKKDTRSTDHLLSILESESIVFNHKKQKILEAMEEDKNISYGYNRGKDVGVWSALPSQPGGSDEIIVDNENAVTFSAYDKPHFPEYNGELLTAGGHIHIGGTFVKMLSFEQLKLMVRKLDKKVLPICMGVETKAGEQRRMLYGRKGEFRIKDYGIEYRSPSNAIFWEKNLKVLNKALIVATKIAKTMAL